jgi:hypothetical protein
MQELNSLFQTALTALSSTWQVGASSIGMLVLFLWITARTGSRHSLHKRLWRLVLGKHEIKSPALATFIDERDDLMHFRAVTSLKRVPTLAAAERLVSWLKRNDIDIDLVAAAGPHFDLDQPGFARPPPTVLARAVLLISAAATFYGGLAVAGLGAVTPALIQIKASKAWYAVTPDQAQRFEFGVQSAPQVNKTDCAVGPPLNAVNSYPVYDVTVLCELLSSEEGKAVLRNAHRSQIALAGVATLALLLFAAALFRANAHADKADRLHRLVEKRRAVAQPAVERGPAADKRPAATDTL